MMSRALEGVKCSVKIAAIGKMATTAQLQPLKSMLTAAAATPTAAPRRTAKHFSRAKQQRQDVFVRPVSVAAC